jgi:7,8-dihydropterin-6-yl-methyl-4-(beta-D-ribofuranosyl)aminobenzene 5'-phosphate synthase
MFDIHVVYDNLCSKEGFKRGFGFGALIFSHFTKEYTLFDVGEKYGILKNNLDKLNVDVFKIKNIIISHSHLDHTGSLSGIIKENEKFSLYTPYSNLRSFKSKFPSININAYNEIMEIEENMFLSGEFGETIKEQFLFLKKDEKLMLLVGCAHPGLEKFILYAQNYGNLYGIIGGFHGFNKLEYLKNIKQIVGCHCTKYKNRIMKEFPGQYVKICVGNSIKF